jgi:hypothetical protein
MMHKNRLEKRYQKSRERINALVGKLFLENPELIIEFVDGLHKNCESTLNDLLGLGSHDERSNENAE